MTGGAPFAAEVRLVAAVVARGGVLLVVGGRLACRLPRGEALPPDLAAVAAGKDAVAAALTAWDLEEIVANIVGMNTEERDAYRAALAHDLAALAAAEARLAEAARGGERR